ncbi:MAG: hypothetical protein E7092_08935 [Bacteroidales bacterium]|nr:hypothetical protein [Bacteroidales bacterium]
MKQMMKRILYILAISLSILACTDEIDKSNRFTFIGETMADYLLNRSEKYSHMITLLKRAGLLSLLNTYGQYTLFLPDNASIEKFVAEKDSVYHATIGTSKFINTGISSPLVDELSDSMANVIARMHLIDRGYRMADFGEGAIGKWNFVDKILSINYKVVDERFYIMLNNHSAIIDGDNEVENGFVHIIDKPLDTKHTTIANHIMEHSFFSIFSRAIGETGFNYSIADYIDYAYKFPDDIPSYFPKQKYIKYTAFVEPDEVFRANGIHTLDDLKAFAEKWYGTEDRDNPRSPKNALHKFVAYHFVEGEIAYNRIVPSRSGLNNEYYDDVCSTGHDLYNYFATMQGTLLKVLKPLSTTDGLNIYINYSKRTVPYNYEMRKHLNVRIMELTEFTRMNEEYADFVPVAANGIIHPIDKILVYNEDEMAGNILNERMRFDAAALFPELSSNNIWQNESMEFPGDYCKGIKRYGTERYLGYYCPYSYYNCDCIPFTNRFDWAIKLPPVPSRTYEIRINVQLNKTPILISKEDTKMQIYLDDVVCDVPLNLDLTAKDERIGWVADNETYDNGAENDKLLRNKGWMKAPDSYCSSDYYSYLPARDAPLYMRKIITREHLTDGEHWLRFRNLSEDAYGLENNYNVAYYLLDYIEIVPLHIVSDPTKPEDRH